MESLTLEIPTSRSLFARSDENKTLGEVYSMQKGPRPCDAATSTLRLSCATSKMTEAKLQAEQATHHSSKNLVLKNG